MKHLNYACLPDMLREQARAHPGDTAVVHGKSSLTYSDLTQNSSDLAVFLQHLGIGSNDCVGLFLQPSIALMTGVWGTLMAGGAYLPLSPEYPEERLRYMIDDARLKIIITQRELATVLARLAPRETTVVTLDDAARFTCEARAGRRECGTSPGPDDLAYVIYTSGSTGKPKGVMIEHRSIVNQMRWLNAVHHLDRDTTVLQKTPLSFDAAQWEILAPSCGSRVIMGSPGIHRDPEMLLETIAEHDVTALQCVPTLLQALLDTGLGSCQSLKQIFSGGEALSRSLALQCLEMLPQCQLINLYGPTECTINSSSCIVDRDTVADGPLTVSIGAPVHGVSYYILDEHRSPTAVGEVGELHIGGVQLARGYLNQPDLTASKFIADPRCPDDPRARLYKSGDLACWNSDGTVQFVGRADNQVKIRGFRVELDEVRLSIEAHDWVKSAAVVVRTDSRTGFQNLVAFTELDPEEAVLMDQGSHGAHHQSKASRLQVRAQLSAAGCRDAGELTGKTMIDLPGKVATQEQRQRVFARKTYRFYHGGAVSEADILQLLRREEPEAADPRDPTALSPTLLGEILRYFGQYHSDQRLLPKHGYASPGSLYATQIYLEIGAVAGLAPGYYYYHPVNHQLIMIREKNGSPGSQIKIHFVGKKRAIEPVYKLNIQEVLEIEVGHMVGLFEEILPAYGLGIKPLEYAAAVKEHLECAGEDYYLGTFEMVRYASPQPDDAVDIYVQAHPGKVSGLSAGHYHYQAGSLSRISDDLILKKHVVAINQQPYERSGFGVTVVSQNPADWLRYIDLGRKLQRLEMNDIGIGFMSSGYSSRTGHDLPSAKRIEDILKTSRRDVGPSYFFVGGRVSEQQVRSEGMNEDVVHMKGPAELIKDDLVNFLPAYMLPNRVVVLDKLPLTPSGKIDFKALEALADIDAELAGRPLVAPRTTTEARISELWKREMKRDAVSVVDNFFESGGNSLIAVGLINKINRESQCALPLQAIFEAPTIEKLARRVDGPDGEPSSRLVRLHAGGSKEPVYCWPGLGGYPMNLRLLAGRLGIDRPFYGVQAHGINEGESPYSTIKEMAAADIKAIRRVQPIGPYTLWGYSFGARVAFEAAWQLEQSGERVDDLFMIAPGSPKIKVSGELASDGRPAYDNKGYVTILFSVFSGSISGPALEECLRVAKDDESFAAFISATMENLDPELVKRIAEVVRCTYELKYEFRELAGRRLDAPITIFTAHGDDYSFIENSSGYSAEPPTLVGLEADHYSLLREPDVNQAVRVIRRRILTKTTEIVVPHVNIKHFPISLSDEQQSQLLTAVTKAVQSAFRCDEEVISIALEPVEREVWEGQVYIPEIVNRRELLRKSPNY
jgi:amino acid adenylation domain-containing protein